MNGFNRFLVSPIISLDNALGNPLHFLWIKMEKPTVYGAFHICCLIILVFLCLVAVWKRKSFDEKKLDRVLLTFWIIAVSFEVIKQINFSYSPSSDEWSYQWYAFPFQFCSSMMYVLPFAVFVKNKRVREYVYSFLMTYNLFAGIGVMLYPSTVYIEDACINVQTMVHHGLMVLIGVLLYAVKAVKLDYKTVLRGTAVFSILVGTALVLNKIFESKDGFNMFFIDVEGCEIPVLSLFSGKVPTPVFLLIYIVGFTVCAAIIAILAYGITRALHIRKSTKAKT